MGLIRKRTVAADRWRLELAATDGLPSDALAPGDIIVSLQRWVQDAETLLSRDGQVGVRIGAGDDIGSAVTPALLRAHLIDFHFDSFADGRAYSQARLLRSRHGYQGVIRASGDVSRDRLSFMERCGFDEFRLESEEDLQAAVSAFNEISLQYQPDRTGAPTVARRRGYRTLDSASPAAGSS